MTIYLRSAKLVKTATITNETVGEYQNIQIYTNLRKHSCEE